MPEGDTIWKLAQRLAATLVGRPVLRFDAPRLTGPRPRPGATIVAVEAVGKYLVVRFGDGVLLETHLRMTGSWHLYEAGRPWRRARHRARVVIAVDGWEAVCFDAAVVRTLRGGTAVPRPSLGLGPDLAAPDVDLAAVLVRLRGADRSAPLVDVLLDQRIAAGVGNVYKSELLWIHRLPPLGALGSFDEAVLATLYRSAHELLRYNIARRGARVTVPSLPGGIAVYRRARRPCPRCGSAIRRAELGRWARPTYWCGRCQPEPAR
ncbi:MAG: formamidopyrimidine DNA glycosylase [Acidimicrobiia bacterium]|nr:formamidopyrimidine DNA glycosylase [Acidimicrobiia bacterium]